MGDVKESKESRMIPRFLASASGRQGKTFRRAGLEGKQELTLDV